jgi:RND family efflux transporter MFP subunit
MKRRELVPIVLLAVALYGCRSKEPDNPSPKEKETEATSQDEAIRLKPDQVVANGLQVVEVAVVDIASTIVVPGHIRTRTGGEVEVFSPFPGRLTGESSLPQIGDFVAKGQHIADVEPLISASDQFQLATTTIQFKVSLQQAQQDLERAQEEVDIRRIELNRFQQLYEGGAIPLKQVQTGEFDLKQAETKLQGARRTAEQFATVPSAPNSATAGAPIVAPIAGTVLGVGAAMGQQIDPTRSLLKIADLSTVWVEAAVQEHDLDRTRQAKTAEITIPESGEQRLPAKLVTIGSAVDPQNRTVPIVYLVDNRDRVLKIEMFVQVRIPTGSTAKALVIPSSAVLSTENASAVYVETQPGAFSRRTVQLGQRSGASVVVISGLNKGEKVVSVGAQALLSESRKAEIPVDTDEKEKKQ